MTTATLTVRMDGAATPGPALGRARFPLGTIALSAVVHAMIVGGLMAAGAAWRAHQPKTYVVNLVPSVAAVGTPEGRPTPVPAPPAPATPAPPPPPTPTPLPEREPAKAPVALPDRTAPRTTAPEMPSRETRTPSSGLPDRTLQARAPALPRAAQKELPPVAEGTPRPSTTPLPTTPAPSTRREAAVAPPPPVGRPSGSPVGAGALTLSVGDFPFAWYLQQLQKKISERWVPPANAAKGQRAVIVFEIRRDGQLGSVSVETKSGDFLYDQAALRAVSDATPFPELPKDYAQPVLRVHLGFNFADNRG